MQKRYKFVTFFISVCAIVSACRGEGDYQIKTTFVKSSSSGAPVMVDETTNIKADNDSLAYVQAFQIWKLLQDRPAAPGRTPVRFRLYDHDDKQVFSPY